MNEPISRKRIFLMDDICLAYHHHWAACYSYYALTSLETNWKMCMESH